MEPMFEQLLTLSPEEIAEIASETADDGLGHAAYVVEMAQALIAMGED